MAWRWAVLLTVALVAPVTLPAGGIDRRKPEVLRRRQGEPLLALGNQPLSCAPHQGAPAVGSLEPGVPLEVVRSWREPGGSCWLQVSSTAGKGWLAV
jgi:hypothetical protein